MSAPSHPGAAPATRRPATAPADRGGTLDSDDVARRFAAGAPDAMDEVYAAHGRLVFNLCLAALGQRQDAEDCAQQVFVRAWRFRSSYDPGRPLGAWLTGITRRVVADAFSARDRGRQAAEAAAEPGRRADGSLSDHVVDRILVHHALEELGPPQDEILRMAFLEDLPQRQIANRMDMPVGTVKSHVHRGLARLREALEVHGG